MRLQSKMDPCMAMNKAQEERKLKASLFDLKARFWLLSVKRLDEKILV